MHPSIPALLKYFDYEHLDEDLQRIAEPFYNVAHMTAEDLGQITEVGAGAQLNRCLHKLLEAKDCAVRAALGLRDA